MEILPSVHLIDDVKGSNAYLLADDKLVLIDTGLPGNESTSWTLLSARVESPRSWLK